VDAEEEGETAGDRTTWTHVFGHELRLVLAGELVASQVCRSEEDIHGCQEAWRAALEAKGWRKV
jgi:hypothetical protein